MGYTHYWVLLPGFNRDAFAQATQDMAQMIHRSEIPVAGPKGIWGTSPQITPTRVAFNGTNWKTASAVKQVTDQDADWGETNESAEPFGIDAEQPGWDWCKTRRQPYDSIVAACILVVKHHLPEHLFIKSDGKWDAEWAHGAWGTNISPVQLYEHLFPERSPVPNPIGMKPKVYEEGRQITLARWCSQGRITPDIQRPGLERRSRRAPKRIQQMKR